MPTVNEPLDPGRVLELVKRWKATVAGFVAREKEHIDQRNERRITLRRAFDKREEQAQAELGMRIAELLQELPCFRCRITPVQPVHRDHLRFGQLHQERVFLPAAAAPGRPHIEQCWRAGKIAGADGACRVCQRRQLEFGSLLVD